MSALTGERRARYLFVTASYGGDLRTVEEFLEAGFDVNKDWFGGKALTEAAKGGHADVVELLLAVPGIKVNAKSCYEGTALNMAALTGRVDIVRLLLAHPDIDVNAGNKYGRTALHYAASRGYFEVVRLLLAHPDIDMNAVDREGATALHVAASRDYDQVVQDLLDAGADPEFNKRDCFTPAYFALQNRYFYTATLVEEAVRTGRQREHRIPWMKACAVLGVGLAKGGFNPPSWGSYLKDLSSWVFQIIPCSRKKSGAAAGAGDPPPQVALALLPEVLSDIRMCIPPATVGEGGEEPLPPRVPSEYAAMVASFL